MSRLPQVSGKRVVRALKRVGFVELRQAGSHVFLRHQDDPTRRAVVAVHGGEALPPGTLLAILRGAGISVDALRELL